MLLSSRLPATVTCWSVSQSKSQMADYLTVAEVYRMQYRLIEMFGGLHGVRDKGAVEAAVFRPQTGYYNSLEEEAAALMESLGKNHGFVDGNKRIAFTAADVFLRRNGFYLEVEAADGYAFIYRSMDRQEFRVAQILDWVRQHIRPIG
jgi:death-on-curing protein